MKSTQSCVLAVICTLGFSTIASGQLGRLEECLPIPSYGRELNEYREELRKQHSSPKVQLQKISFETQRYLPLAFQQQLAKELKNRSYDVDSDWTREVEERAL